MQTHLEGVEKDLVPGISKALAHVSKSSLEQIRSASRVGWVDMECNYELNEGIFAAVGIEGGRTFFRELYTEFFQRSLFRAFLQGIRALGAKEPGAYIKHAPRGWEMIWRDLGRVQVGPRDATSIELHFEDQPERVFAPNLPWFEYMAAVFEVAFVLCDVQGRGEIIEFQPTQGRAKIRFAWGDDAAKL